MTTILRHHLFAISLFALCPLGLGSTVSAKPFETTSATIHLNAQEAKSLLQANPHIQILDVRTKGEFKRGHIQGAIDMNYFSPKFKKNLRTLNRVKPYLVHCKSGHRSHRAVKIMQREGFQKIYHLDGGYDAWKKITP